MNRMSRAVLLFVSLCLLLVLQVPSVADDFPQWRGPNRDGISPEKGLIRQWPEHGPEIAWQIDTVGAGYSSVATKDGLIVTMGDLDGIEHVIALKATDGSRVWAAQPEPVVAALNAKVDAEFKQIDLDGNGKIEELEALSRLGTAFYDYDRGDTNGKLAQRAARLFSQLDKNADETLAFDEAGKAFRDELVRMDSVGNADPLELANTRAEALIKQADADGDSVVTKKEARKSYLSVIFSKADKKDGDNPKGDQKLTRDEIVRHLTKRERGKDGRISEADFIKYFENKVNQGNGELSRTELSSFYGGYRNGQGDGPRGTPTIAGDRVYVEGGNGDVTCLELQTGKTIWYTSLVNDLGGNRPGWGYSESPLIVNDWVIVTPGGDQGTLAALNKLTGEVVWRSSGLTEKAHYSSPIVATIGGVEQIVQFARESMFGVRLADGKLLWNYDGANNGTANCCTPVVDQNHVFAASAYGTGGGLAKITGSGEQQSSEEVYFEKKMAIHHGGIVKIGDYLYSNGAGTLICMDFLTGDIAWQDRSVGKGSLMAADGMLYVLGEKHELALVEANPDEYLEHGRIELESHGRPSWAHPVIAEGILYIRDQESLTAYKVR